MVFATTWEEFQPGYEVLFERTLRPAADSLRCLERFLRSPRVAAGCAKTQSSSEVFDEVEVS
jgi:hypothetical protein